jgi:hypothetical protein
VAQELKASTIIISAKAAKNFFFIACRILGKTENTVDYFVKIIEIFIKLSILTPTISYLYRPEKPKDATARKTPGFY